MRSRLLFTLAVPFLALTAACGGDEAHDHAGHDHGADHDHAAGHVHVAPHGGALVVLGEEALHVEFVLDADGRISAYVLDGEAVAAVRLAEDALTLQVTLPDAPAFELRLDAVASALTGETVGDTSEFGATEARLAGQKRFSGLLGPLEARGVSFEAVPFTYPEGNE